MSVPTEHMTPKLESLPKGLREQAESLIKKKFGIVDETAKAIQKAVDGMSKLMYSIERQEFRAIAKCMSCGSCNERMINRRAVEGKSSYRFAQPCRRCGSIMESEITHSEFIRAYDMSRGRPDPRYYDQPVVRPDPRFIGIDI